MTKKLLSLLVAVLMVLALVPMGAMAKAEAEVESFNKITQRVRLNDGFRFAESRTKAGVTDSRDTEYVCDGSVYSFDFETSYSSEGWWTYDRDSTNYTYDNWLQNSGFGVDDSVAMISLSYYNGVGAMNQDNWLISPEITVPSDGTYYLSYWASSVDSSYLDKMQVLVAEAGSGAYNASSGTISYNSWTSLRSLESIPAEYTNYMIDLSSYAGKTVSFAFRHYCNDYYILCLDDVAVGRRVEMIYETGVTLDKSTLSIDVTGAGQINATVAPEDATYSKVTWTSSDPSVAAVNDAGGIIGLAAGTATITATTKHGLTATCTVTVTAGDNEFDTNMKAFGTADYDANAYVHTWYNIDQYGELSSLYADGSNFLYITEYDAGDGLVYAYLAHVSNNSLTSMDFVSVDPENNYAVTTIKASVSDYPEWMAYDYATDTMYGGFLYADSNNQYHFDIATIDLTSGEKGETAVDVYNATYEYNGSTGTYYFVPYYMTCAGDGWFIGVDANYDAFILYILDYNGQGFTPVFLSDMDISEMVGNISSYTQKIWYNPLDGMVYWAADFDTVNMVVLDVVTGIAARTGIVGASGATYGVACSCLYTPYTVTVPTYIVTFVDGLTNEPIAEIEVEEGSDATPPTPPAHEGYTFDHWEGDYTNVTDNVTVTAVYTLNSYTLTIEYYSEAGEELAPAYTAQVPYGTAYEVPSPEIDGYTTETTVVSGTMPAEDVEVKVIYTAVVVPPAGLPGDVNCDGKVNMADLSALSAYMLGKADLTPQGLINADVSGDGNVDARDLPLIYQLTLDN